MNWKGTYYYQLKRIKEDNIKLAIIIFLVVICCLLAFK